MPGTLYVVATPIGNLEDVTFRALRILREVHLIAAEDTRRTARLLAHYDIRTSVISLREHNEARETPRLLQRLSEGQDIALVSDAGTPVVSDPGARLVRAVRDSGLRVSPIPGPSAVTAALSVAGFGGDQFVFMGFPPASGQDRREWLDAVRQEKRTVVLFESPHRLARTLGDLAMILANRPIFIARELTKIHETLVTWPDQTAGSSRGEFTVVIGPHSGPEPRAIDDGTVARLVGCLTTTAGLELDSASALAAKAFDLPVARVRKSLKLERYARHQGRKLDD